MDLKNKTVVLTGANGGFGRELAHQLADAGARLILVGKGQDELDLLVTDLDGDEAKHCALDLDLSCEAGIEELVNFCEGLPSGIDILVNSAGLNRFALLDDYDFAATSKLMMVNLVAPIMLTSKLLPILKSRNDALIVNIGSALGAIGNPGYSAYCASKAGLARFSETLRRELSDCNVEVLHLNPRVIRTAMNSDAVNSLNQKLGNKADAPETVARILLSKILRNKFRDHYVGWPEKFFVKINALLPALVDRDFHKNLPLIKSAIRNETISTNAAPIAEATNG